MKIEVIYPESWADVKYSQYSKYYKVIKPYINTDEFEKKSVEAAALHFCNVPAEALYNLPQDVFDKIVTAISNLISTDKQPLVQTFEVENTKYGFIPSLDEIAYGEYLDLVNYFKETWENIPIIMSILYRPVTKELGKQYTVESYTGTNDARIEMFKHVLTMDIVFGATAFFLDLQKDLLSGTLTYLTKSLKKMKDPKVLAALEDLQKSGVDTIQWLSLLKMMLQNLNK